MSLTESTIVTDTDVEDAETTMQTLERAAQLKADREEAEERPDWLPEEFASVTDFLNDYQRLRGEPTEEETTEESEGLDDTEETDAQDEEESDQDEPTGVDFDALTVEFSEHGNLSEETFEALEAAGIPRSLVEGHIAGIQAQEEVTRLKAANAFGGEENFNNLLQWAGQSLPEKDIDRINDLVSQGDFDGYLLAMEGVRARYEATYGSMGGQTIQGDTATVADIYGSQEEMKSDMRDPRYAKDEAFRSKVAAKVSRTRRAS
jgi:hypothetical protein